MGMMFGLVKLILKIVAAPVVVLLTLAIWICVGLVYVSGLVLGLISMGSATLDYHLTGTMYFEGPLGAELPVPVDIGRIGSYN